MARVIPKRSTDEYLMVGYRPIRGQREVEWRCPDHETFVRFRQLVEAAWEVGTPIPDPVELFGEVPKKPSKAELKRRQRDTVLKAQPEVTPYTLREWLGTSKDHGPYFQFNRKAQSNAIHYFPIVNRYGSHFVNKRLDEIDWQDAELMLKTMLVCPACEERAKRDGAIEYTLNAPDRLSAAGDPYGGHCLDDEGESAHYSRLQQSTMRAYLGHMKTAMKAASQAGRPGRGEPRCRVMVGRENPFDDHHIPTNMQDRPDDNDISQALTYRQLHRLDDAMPVWLHSAATTGAYGILRRSELLGLEIGMIEWCTDLEAQGQAVITLTKTFLDGKVRGWGKNKHSIGRRIFLHPLAARRLRTHIERNRSTPSPDTCEGCRAGMRDCRVIR